MLAQSTLQLDTKYTTRLKHKTRRGEVGGGGEGNFTHGLTLRDYTDHGHILQTETRID